MYKIEVSPSDLHPQYSYINEFVKLTCAPDLLALNLFPNAKEITESMAAYRAVRKYGREFEPKDTGTVMFSVGDGRTPRTASLFAFRSAWQCYSIDPNLNMNKSWGEKITRLHCYANKIEDVNAFDGTGAYNFDRVVIVAVHSHAKLEDAVKVIKAKEKIVVAIPCCVKQTIYSIAPKYEYFDKGIWSPENKVKIWKFKE